MAMSSGTDVGEYLGPPLPTSRENVPSLAGGTNRRAYWAIDLNVWARHGPESGVLNADQMASLYSGGDSDLVYASLTAPEASSVGERDIASQALSDTEIASDDNPETLSTLGITLFDRFTREGDIRDLDRAIVAQRKAVLLTSTDHPKMWRRLTNLGLCLSRRFRRLGVRSDVDEAIDIQDRAVSLLDDTHSAKSLALSNLGVTCAARYQHFGDVTDLDKAISSHEQAAALASGDEDKAIALHNLAIAFYYLSGTSRKVTDVEMAISRAEEANALTPSESVHRPKIITTLANALTSRFELTRAEPDDLDRAIILFREALDLTHTDDASRPHRLQSLGVSLRTRFEWTGNLPDIDEGISLQEQSVALTPESDIWKPERLGNLGNSLRRRFDRLGNLPDADRAIKHHEQAVLLTRDEHKNKPMYLSNLAMALVNRFERTDSSNDLVKAISCQKKAIALMRGGSDPSFYIELGNSLARLYQRYKDGQDSSIDEAVALSERTVALASDDDARKPAHLNNLATVLMAKFESTRDALDITQAISHLEHAIGLLPDGYAQKSKYFWNLGMSYISRFQVTGDRSDVQASMNAYRTAADAPTNEPSLRFKAALQWAKVASERDPSQLLEAHGTVISLISRLIWLGTPVSRRYSDIESMSDAVNNAAATAIALGEYELAVEWLEQGRSLVWGQLLQLRTPIQDLQAVDAALADELMHVSQALEHAETSQIPDIGDMETASLARRRLAERWDELVEDARRIAGFEGFLKPKKMEELVGAARLGPVVIINIHDSRCDALIVQNKSEQRVVNVELSTISVPSIDAMKHWLRRALKTAGVRAERGSKAHHVAQTSDFEKVLRILWGHVVTPVLDSLGYLNQGQATDLPHLTWCATGAMATLPLHAAGVYTASAEIPSKVFDCVISSYTPSLSTLLASRRDTLPEPALVGPGILAISQPSTPGQSPLPGTTNEVKAIQKHIGNMRWTWLNKEEATVGHVLEGMKQNGWIHLACHAIQRSDDPRKSAFLLDDGPLEISTIIQQSLSCAEFAFLSACQTATGDETLPDEAIHLAAGMLMAGYRTVLATMWSIRDSDGPVIADGVYSELIEAGRSDKHYTAVDVAARALHNAVAHLRRQAGEKAFERWIPFIHVGQ